MKYLFISFYQYLDRGQTKSQNSLSLNEQYTLLQKRIPLERKVPFFEDFIELCFPTGLEKTYYISCPNFLRHIEKKYDGSPSYLYNLVIRPELTAKMKSALPDNQNIILIGDIFEGDKLRMFMVKGIQFIDASMSSPNDLAFTGCAACNSFSKGTWSINRVDWSDTILTPDNISSIIEGCWTVDNKDEVLKNYFDWKEYINFRKYYLEEQSKRSFRLDRAEVLNSYAINRKEYKSNASVYEDYLLEGRKEFSKGDMIVLSEKVGNAEEFPLVRLDIERNKKEFDEAKIEKGGKLISEEEKKLSSLASDNVFITTADITKEEYGTKRNSYSEWMRQGYILGDRFKIISYDIEPTQHVDELNFRYKNDVSLEYKKIESRYERKIIDEVNKFLSDYEKEIDVFINSKLEEKRNQLYELVSKEQKKEKDVANEINILKTKYGKEKNQKLQDYKEKKKKELESKYKEDIRVEKINKQKELKDVLDNNIRKVIEEETIIRFSLYFRLGDYNNTITEKQEQIVNESKFIVYDNRAEKAKISRQETALENFYSGNVNNPYLSTYLFSPEKLDIISIEPIDWTWYLPSLNEKQREAVRKATQSNGLFLLQGPPGTGKTQVIAETVAHLVKEGKKVLISSETHKAIDNVFERLPKIPEIVPIRLILSMISKKENDYDPKFLVDNLYTNIASNMEKSINRYNNFEENKQEFDTKYKGLVLLKDKIDKNQKFIEKANEEIRKLDDKAKEKRDIISSIEEERVLNKERLDILRRTRKHIENDNIDLSEEEDVETILIANYRKDIESLLSKDKDSFNISCGLSTLLKNISNIKAEEIRRELSIIDPDSQKAKLNIRKEYLQSEMQKLRDEFGDTLLGKETELEEFKKELKEVVNQINSSDSLEEGELKIKGIFVYSFINANNTKIQEIIESLKDSIKELKAKYNETIYSLIEKEDKQKEYDDKIRVLKQDINEINEKIASIQDDKEYMDNQDNIIKFQSNLDKFFKDFEILEPYKDENEALKIIKKKWIELDKNFDKLEQETKERIPVYRKIVRYITSNDVIENDRKEFTRDLFDSANVFGMTCTSREKFKGDSIDSLAEFNIESFDIRSVGIDVVIIDEVSKSSFIDLLIPILYGKTVILVGDHRQLPPTYDLSKLRDEDFDGLDENIINKSINNRFTHLYEECFFKTLFEKISNNYKTMLNQQYRCHEDIMNVFNHFYRNELKLGWEGQNNKKKHNINLLSNGRNIIVPSRHIYFVNCNGKETHEADSTSMYNTGEARVIVELISKINNYFRGRPDLERLSIGVICTYGDQSRKIKELMRSERIKTDAFNTSEEKMIVSTVDDFQGDERDIIILSTVRNPENPARSNPGFILAYQRINVALSRARRLLIMVGNRKYLEDKGVINLPDVYGRKGRDQKDFRVYEEILSTIESKGKIFEDVDVLEDKGERLNG